MPKKIDTDSPAVAQAHLHRASPYAEPQNPANLVQRARRRLQYSQSQLPVRSSSARKPQRSHLQQQQQQARLTSSLKKFNVIGAAAAGTPCKRGKEERKLLAAASSGGKRKSLSMIDLTPNLAGEARFEANELRNCESDSVASSTHRSSSSVEGCSSLATWSSFGNHHHQRLRCLTAGSEQEQHEARAAGLVCRALAINAWRRRRQEIVALRADVEDSSRQLEHLQMQIVVLRRLLDNENARVASLAGELHKAKAAMEAVTRERDALRIEKQTAEGEAARLSEISEERLVTAENLRNELRSARDQLDALDKQIAKDREKLLKLREDEKRLLDRISAYETVAEEREARAEKAELSLEDAQIQLATQIGLASSLQEEVQRFLNLLKEKEEEKSKLETIIQKMEEENAKAEERLKASEETERQLNLRAAELENQLAEQELNMQRIEAAYAVQMSELHELRARLIRQSQESGWSSRVLQLAGSVVRAPRVILRTLSFFSTGMPLIL